MKMYIPSVIFFEKIGEYYGIFLRLYFLNRKHVLYYYIY